VKFQNLSGENFEIEADDLLSICLQHENDHLDGIVFIERLSNLKKNFYKKKMKKEKGP
jgi:peptide deformylase